MTSQVKFYVRYVDDTLFVTLPKEICPIQNLLNN